MDSCSLTLGADRRLQLRPGEPSWPMRNPGRLGGGEGVTFGAGAGEEAAR
ncbi:hypothetical protein [Nonomuraea sp. NPDC050783]